VILHLAVLIYLFNTRVLTNWKEQIRIYGAATYFGKLVVPQAVDKYYQSLALGIEKIWC